MSADQKRAYFESWAQDYQSAENGLAGHGRLSQRIINRLFRIKTFALRNDHINKVLLGLELEGKRVLDAGCGPGAQVFFCAANGADATGLDIAPSMISMCEERAKQEESGGGNVQFAVADLIEQPLDNFDIVLSIGVLEYYKSIDRPMKKMCDSADRHLVVCLPRRILWRLVLRKILGLLKGFDVFYHDPERIKSLAASAGMDCVAEWEIHSFHTLLFRSRGTAIDRRDQA